MEERRDISAQETFDAVAGFIVAGHNFGRLDRLDLDELAQLGSHAARLAEEVGKFQEGLRIARERRFETMTLEMKSRYEC